MDALHVSAIGITAAIRLAELPTASKERVIDAWSGALAPEGSAPNFEIRVEPELDLDYALASLSQELTMRAIEERRGQMWMLHAAGLADEDGRVVVLVGPSGRGKTTASTHLGRVFGYVSDETVAIQSDGTVLPYRKPLSIISGGENKEQRSPDQLGLRPLPAAPLRVAAIAILDRDPDGPEKPTAERVPLSQMIGELVAQSSYLAEMSAPLQDIAAISRSVGGFLRVRCRESRDLAPLIRDLLEGAPEEVEIRDARTTTPAVVKGPYRRAPYLDAVEDEAGALAILGLGAVETAAPSGGELVVLGGIGPALWRAADGVGLDALEKAVRDAHGEPPQGDITELVASAVADLHERGVLVSRDVPIVR